MEANPLRKDKEINIRDVSILIKQHNFGPLRDNLVSIVGDKHRLYEGSPGHTLQYIMQRRAKNYSNSQKQSTDKQILKLLLLHMVSRQITSNDKLANIFNLRKTPASS